MRHGQTDANLRINNGESPGNIDPPLNNLGINQAHIAANELKNVNFDAILTSPLKRALQTAEIVNEFHKLPITITDQLTERHLDSYALPDTWRELFDFDKNIRPENGETVSEFFDHVYKFIDKLRQDYKDKTILVVTHGGVGHAFHAYMNNLPLEGNLQVLRMQNCEYRIYKLQENLDSL